MKSNPAQKVLWIVAMGLMPAALSNACSRDTSIAPPTMPSTSADAIDYTTETEIDTIAATAKLPTPADNTEGDPAPQTPTNNTGSDPNTQTPPDDDQTVENPPEPMPAPTPQPEPPVPVIANGRYLLQGVQSQKCIDVPAGQKNNGLQLQIWDCGETNSHQFMTIEFIEQNYYRIVTANKKNLEGPQNNLTPGSPVQQNAQTGLVNQQFSFEATGMPSVYSIKLRGQDLVIEVAGAQTSSSSLLQLAPSQNKANQQWLLIPLN